VIKQSAMAKFKRILLKLSGESLMGDQHYGIDEKRLDDYASQIKDIVGLGIQVGIVFGGGNIFRGLSGTSKGFDRVKGDQMGMLATIINSLALASALGNIGTISKIYTAVRMEPIATFYIKEKAIESLENNEVAIFAGGTGNPYFTTDTAGALRAVEIGADVLLKGTRVDGVYTADPEKDSNAKKIDHLTFEEMFSQNLKIMDMTATTLCMENKMPVIVFNMDKKGNLLKLIKGEKIGSVVSISHNF
jgi:uridylate kinase